MNFDNLLKFLKDKNGSDLFITVGLPPTIKAVNKFIPYDEQPLTNEAAQELVLSLLNEKQKKEFLEKKELNFAIYREGLGRFRVSAFQQQLSTGAILRQIQEIIPTFEELGLPETLKKLAMESRGLIIISGATGVGKSSTLAAMMGYRNENAEGHIITIEDPIEFVHTHKKSIVTQREVGIDTESFEIGLRNTLRQAPDVILIGEIRSLETTNYAINFSETGHLCLTTLHASNAYQSLDRLASFFPKESRDQLWLDLSLNLKAIVAQRLVPMVDETKRIAVLEIMINTPVISDYIKRGEISEIQTFMGQTNEMGMQTFEQSLFKLYMEGKISEESALKYADHENEMRLMIKLKKGNKPPSSGGFSILNDQN